MAAEGMPFPWRWDGGTISTNLDVIWGMSVERDGTMAGLLLLVTVTTLYAGYNLLIKVSVSHVPAAATSTIVATICLQVAALPASS